MRQKLGKGIVVGMILALVVVLVNGVISYRNLLVLIEIDERAGHTHEVLAKLQGVLPLVLDTELALREHNLISA